MRHFLQLDDDTVARLFEVRPTDFARSAPGPVLATALGATLYMPGTRPALAADLVRQGGAGVTSSVLCLEDAVADRDLEAAHDNLVDQVRQVSLDGGVADARVPLTFVRVRHPDQVAGDRRRARGATSSVLTGFVLPKFTERTGPAYLEALAGPPATARERLCGPCRCMESPEVMHAETRRSRALAVRGLLDEHRDLVLAVRIGATDLSAAYGLRRGRDLTVYDVRVVADVITDVVNVLGRADGTGYVVTGPVWEHFTCHERLFKPQLRQTPFVEPTHADELRASSCFAATWTASVREVVLDQVNGLQGKTVIHPTHVAVVHALSVVTHEEFCRRPGTSWRRAAAGGCAPRRTGTR